MSGYPAGTSLDTNAPWNRPDAQERECEYCREEGDEIQQGRPYSEQWPFLCDKHWPKCDCGEPAYPESEGALCAQCEVNALLSELPDGSGTDAESQGILRKIFAAREWQRTQEAA